MNWKTYTELRRFRMSSTSGKLILSTVLLLTFDTFVGTSGNHWRSIAAPTEREIPIAAKYPLAEAFFFTAQSQPREYKCEGKIYCSQMTSCEEAKFYLKNCPGVKLDGDGDGIPCESQWCHN